METKIKNAIINDVSINDGERGLVTIWLYLDYGGGGQGFGGHSLYLSKDYEHHTIKGDFAGHFIFRCMQVAGVSKWEDIKGKTIRVKSTHSEVEAIGHIIKEDWFCPKEDFARMRIE